MLTTTVTKEKLRELIQFPNQIKDKIDIQVNPMACQIIDFARSRVIDQSALKAIEDIANRYSSLGKKVKLRHLTRDCHRLLSKTGQLMVESDDDPDYSVAVDYEVKIGIFGK